MKKCSICGRETNATYNLYGYKNVCSKHMHQILKYGKPLDDNPRTNKDLNDYRIEDNIAIFNIYNQKNEKIDEFIIDLEDIERVKYHKWRKNHGHVVTGLPAKGNQRDLSHVVLNVTKEEIQSKHIVVDHINGDAMDNRKQNLRICSQSENVLNKSFMSNNTSNFIGVSYRKDRDRYDPEIRKGYIRCHLGYTIDIKDAVYKRLYAEKILFKEFANQNEIKKKEDFVKDLSSEKKRELEQTVIEKLKNKNFGHKLY